MASSEKNVIVNALKTMTVGPPVESLGDVGFSATTKWAGSGDWSDTISGNTTYTHSSGSGSLTQVNGDQDIVNVATSPYRLAYTLTSVTSPSTITMTLTTWGAALTVDLPTTAGTHSVDFTSGSSTSGSFVISVVSVGAGIFTMDDITLIHGSAEQIKTTRQEVLTLTVRAQSDNSGTITLVNDAHSTAGVPLNAGDVASFSAEVYDTIDLRDMFWRASVDTDGFHYSYRQ